MARRGGLHLLRRLAGATLGAACLLTSLAAAAGTCDSGELAEFVASRYGPAISFDVLRNGKTVGEHVTRFDVDDDGIAVESRMRLDISILLVPVYDFTYVSRARWCDDGLVELDARVDDNGDERRTRAVREDDELVVRHGTRELRTAATMMPTDHWNPRVVGERQVLNTLTGNVNDVTITPCARGEPAIERAAPGSVCYAYSGALDTRVWYAADGRWSGLAFEGGDGSQILYVCRDCAKQAI
ncbi:MAG: DUF6134 family protein [Gammaproteobacteria bacterium]